MRSADVHCAQASPNEPWHPRPRRDARWAWALITLVMAFAAAAQLAPAHASVFRNSSRWSPGLNGYTVIQVCITGGSSATQRNGGTIHEPNPSLEDVVGQVRDALRTNWEAYSSIRFVGWRDCQDLSTESLRAAIKLYIHPEAPNVSRVGTESRFTPRLLNFLNHHYEPGTQIKPWGNGAQCITYRARGVSEYRFSCVREYAVHEFGHAIGFLHEWQHPSTPAACRAVQLTDNKHETPVSAGDASDVYDPNKPYTIVNPPHPLDGTLGLAFSYDWSSIMTYGDKCAKVNGERFGSWTLEAWDQKGVATVYPPVAQRPNDVGVIPDVRGSCPEPSEVKIYMDNEDTNNSNSAQGWIGAISSGRNTMLEFCKVDGRALKGLRAPSTGSANYAVLKLGDRCPAGSEEFVRYHDDQNQPPLNISWMAGEVGPTRQNFGGLTGTLLHWCLFEQVGGGSGAPVMNAFPSLGFRYGVVAARDFIAAERTGSVYTDDEDTGNGNLLWDGRGPFSTPAPRMRAVLDTLMEFGTNTRIKLALVA